MNNLLMFYFYYLNNINPILHRINEIHIRNAVKMNLVENMMK